MRRFLFGVGFVLFCVICSHAYIPLLREGFQWKCVMEVDYHYSSGYEFPDNYPYTIIIEGDSVVDGISYKKCHYIVDDSIDTQQPSIVLLREDIETRQIYKREYDSDELIYDFKNLTNEEQEWTVWMTIGDALPLEVDSVWTTLIDGVGHPSYRVSSGESYFILIEGVGTMGIFRNNTSKIINIGDLANPMIDLIVGYVNYIPHFLHLCDSSGRIIYDAPAEIEDYIDISGMENLSVAPCVELHIDKTSLSVHIGTATGTVELNDLSGRVVAVEGTDCEGRATIDTGTLPAGLYLVRVTTPAGITTRKVVF